MAARLSVRRQSLVVLAVLIMRAAGAGGQTPARPVPDELAVLMKKARTSGAIVASCKGTIIDRGRASWAVAIVSEPGGGVYAAVSSDGNAIELARFAGGAELSCYEPSQARKLNTTIKRSETIAGAVDPVSDTTVVCGFIEDTRAVCWQYSPRLKQFVVVGGWIT